MIKPKLLIYIFTLLFSQQCFGGSWTYTKHQDELTDQLTTSAYGHSIDYKYLNDYTIGFQCSDNTLRFVVDTDSLIRNKSEEFEFSYRVDKKEPNSIQMRVYSNNNEGGYTTKNVRSIAKDTLGGNAIFVRTIDWDNDYLQTTIKLNGSDAAINKVFKDCGNPLFKEKASDHVNNNQEPESEKARQQFDKEIANEAKIALFYSLPGIHSALASSWIRPASVGKGLKATVRITVRPTGEVINARVARSSGSTLFDRSAEIAALKASPLSIPTDPRFYPTIREFEIEFTP